MASRARNRLRQALYQALGIKVWGPSVLRMLQHLPPEHRPPKELIDGAKELDRHYIPTHRPDFHPGGLPWATTPRRMLGGLLGMQRRSSSSAGVKFHKLDYERVLKALRRYAENLVSEGRAGAVILVGSLARGDYTAYSDADVIVVVDRAAERPIDRLAEYIDPTLPIDIEPRVYTRSEIPRIAREGRRIVDEVLRYGKLLVGNRSVVEELRRVYKGGTGESSS